MFSICPSSALDWEILFSTVEKLNEDAETEEVISESGEILKVKKHDGKKSFNLSVDDFKKATIIEKIKECHPDAIDKKIYFWEHGNYFVTDKKVIFSMKKYLSPEAIENYRDGIKQVDMKTTKEIVKQHQKAALLKALNSSHKKAIYKKIGKERHIKLHVRKSSVSHLIKLGYNISREESYFQKYDAESGRFSTYEVFSTRMSRDAFISMCMAGTDVEKGFKLENGETVAIKRGRKGKKITVRDSKNKKHSFHSLGELAEKFEVSLVTVKRKFAHAKTGDIVQVKRGVKLTLEK